MCSAKNTEKYFITHCVTNDVANVGQILFRYSLGSAWESKLDCVQSGRMKLAEASNKRQRET